MRNKRDDIGIFPRRLTAYRKLFWPDFIEHDNCVFLAFDKIAYQQWLQQNDGNKRRVEAIMNHRHVVDLLPASIDKPTQSLVVSFGKLLRETLEAKLKRDFPTKSFCINFPLDERKVLTDYEITFYQTV